MKNRIQEIGEILWNFCGTFNLKVSDDVFFKEVLTCYRGEEASKGNKQYQKPSVKKVEEKEELATEPQKKYIYNNNLDVNTEGLTKKEATKLIGEHKIKNEKKFR